MYLMYRLRDWHITSDQSRYPDTACDKATPATLCAGHTGRHTEHNFFTDHVLLRPDLEQWNDQTNVKYIVFIWMFVGDTRLFEVGAGESWLIMSCPGQARLAWAPVNVTFISQPPSNQMSLFPTYLITVLIYGIISYQTQNLPQLKLWQSGPLTPLHVWRIHVLGHFLPFQSPDPCVPCHTVTPQTAGKTNIPSLIHQMNENFLTNELKME